MSCLAFMTLRSPCSTAQFLIESGTQILLEIMQKHIDNSFVLVKLKAKLTFTLVQNKIQSTV